MIRALQQMLADKVRFHYNSTSPYSFSGICKLKTTQTIVNFQAFRGHENTSESWVLSVTSLSGAFNGTTRAYLDGMQ